MSQVWSDMQYKIGDKILISIPAGQTMRGEVIGYSDNATIVKLENNLASKFFLSHDHAYNIVKLGVKA